MTIPVTPADFLTVAEQLNFDHSELIAADWSGVELARFRSSVSRAYYAAFLYLRDLLIPLRAWPGGLFPDANAHRRVILALERALGSHHRIPTKFRALLDARHDADYHLNVDVLRRDAEGRCDESDDLIHWIDSLSDDKLRDIANRV